MQKLIQRIMLLMFFYKWCMVTVLKNRLWYLDPVVFQKNKGSCRRFSGCLPVFLAEEEFLLFFFIRIPQLAAELGTIALIANIIREIFALLGAPLFVRYFGRLSPICAGGATTMDTTLPIITRYCGKDLVFVSIFHGILVDFTVPFFVSFFCSM